MRGTYCQFRFMRFLGIQLNKYMALKWTNFLKAGLHVLGKAVIVYIYILSMG